MSDSASFPDPAGCTGRKPRCMSISGLPRPDCGSTDARLPTVPKTNNFDLIRLAAALQVAFIHAAADLGVAAPWPLRPIAEWFPGVPIFFFISGFLISKSFEKNSVVREYAQNRFLRIYPGLAVCFLVSLASVWFT